MCRKKIHIRQNETIERKRQMNEKDIWKLVLAGLGENHNLSPMTVNLWFDTMSMEKLTPEAAFFPHGQRLENADYPVEICRYPFGRA